MPRRISAKTTPPASPATRDPSGRRYRGAPGSCPAPRIQLGRSRRLEACILGVREQSNCRPGHSMHWSISASLSVPGTDNCRGKTWHRPSSPAEPPPRATNDPPPHQSPAELAAADRNPGPSLGRTIFLMAGSLGRRRAAGHVRVVRGGTSRTAMAEADPVCRAPRHHARINTASRLDRGQLHQAGCLP